MLVTCRPRHRHSLGLLSPGPGLGITASFPSHSRGEIVVVDLNILLVHCDLSHLEAGLLNFM